MHISKHRYILTHTHPYTDTYTCAHIHKQKYTQTYKTTQIYTQIHRDRHDIHTYVLLMGRYPLRNMYKVTH